MSKFVSINNPGSEFFIKYSDLCLSLKKGSKYFFQRGMKGPVILKSYSGDCAFLKEGDVQCPFEVSTTEDGFLCFSNLESRHWLRPLAGDSDESDDNFFHPDWSFY